MENLSRRTLSFLSLLVIVGILSIPYFNKTYFIFIPMIMCLIGGISFGTLVRKTHQNKDWFYFIVYNVFGLGEVAEPELK